MTLTTSWLEQTRHPSEDECFALPNAIYFLLNFRNDLAGFKSHVLDDRVALYLWWESVASVDYPDFDWELRDIDLEWLRQIDNETLIAGHPRAIAYWLKGVGPSVFDGRGLTRSMLASAGIGTGNALELPAFFLSLLASRIDLQRAFDLNTIVGRLSCVSWWEERGQVEYPRIAWSPANILSPLLKPGSSDFVEGVPLPRLLRLIHDERADLSAAFDIETFTGRIGYLDWWGKHRKEQYSSVRWTLHTLPRSLFEVDPAGGAEGTALPHFLRLIWNDRPDLQRAFDLKTFTSWIAYLSWWDAIGQKNYPLIHWTSANILETLLSAAGTSKTSASGLPDFLESIWLGRKDLQAAFDIKTAVGVDSFVEWWEHDGREEYRPLRSISVTQTTDNVYTASAQRIWKSRPFGVNIVGFPQGVLGLGEDARMAAHALGQRDIPRVVLNAPMAGPARIEHSVDDLLSEDLSYSASLFCLPPPEMLRLALEGGRSLIETDTYRIGAWPWELPQWPAAFGRLHQFVDEIWAQSRYVQSALARQNETPVYQMPFAVGIPEPERPERKRFGLPEKDFLFYLMFDGNSWLTRKNPMAGIHAFQQAFEASVGGVGLVIKAMNVHDVDPVWRSVLNMAARDSRIRIVSERLNRQDTIDFMASCDAYISLHRSEGFGRVIAEAMLLGQPVVVTNFSGNTDFCDAGTAFLVDGELVPLRPGDYLFHEAQYWCDPDVATAAQQIRAVVEDTVRREQIAKAGQQRIQRDYSIEAVSRAFASRLNEIHGKPQS
ncbi:glycosyltransferase family 4 protein [Paraburkholderia tropica]|uniref:glycosyltransferase family 4 protein n=1 Tax=Paraburkholderia tropica TaxID=92647 RepID=UPI002AB65997|nr:glycosyltransferase family 4 protein [Paraburkholderia tropica]